MPVDIYAELFWLFTKKESQGRLCTWTVPILQQIDWGSRTLPKLCKTWQVINYEPISRFITCTVLAFSFKPHVKACSFHKSQTVKNQKQSGTHGFADVSDLFPQVCLGVSILLLFFSQGLGKRDSFMTTKVTWLIIIVHLRTTTWTDTTARTWRTRRAAWQQQKGEGERGRPEEAEDSEEEEEDDSEKQKDSEELIDWLIDCFKSS